MADHKAYLKKYLSEPTKKNKVKKKKKVLPSKSRIIDDDIGINNNKPESDETDKELEDEAPIVASVIDDRPLHIRSKEAYVTSHWKTLDDNEKNSNDQDSLKNKGGNRTRHDSDSDLSPVRGQDVLPSKTSQKSQSDKRKKSNHRQNLRNDSDHEISPPKRRANANLEYNNKSVNSQHKFRHDSGSDLSPPRDKIATNKSDSDVSPPRRSDNYKPSNKKRARQDSGSDLSPPRNKTTVRNQSDSDISPPRKGKQNNSDNEATSSTNSHKRRSNSSNLDKRNRNSTETLSGLKAGLQDARALRSELQLARKREEDMIKMIGEDVSGKGAETIFRDKHSGKKRNLKEEKRLQRIENEKKAKFDEKYMEWGKGLKQVEERENRLGEDVYEMSKPLARYADDEDLEKHLKEQEREGDPMLKFIKRKKEKQIDPNKVRPTYKGPPPPPNRFGIAPGYRWDGVDRSNGFEKRITERKSNKIALEEEAYKWSVADM